MVDAGDRDIIKYEDKRDLPLFSREKSKKNRKGLESRAGYNLDSEQPKMTQEQKNELYKSQLQIVCGYEQLFLNNPKLGISAIKECLKEVKGKNIIFYILSLNKRYSEFISENYSHNRGN